MSTDAIDDTEVLPDYVKGEKLLMLFTVAPAPSGTPFALSRAHRKMDESFETWIEVTVANREAFLVGFRTSGGTLFWRDVATIPPESVRRTV